MDVPPVQYVKTSDGYDIAYAVTGEGPRTLVMAPLPFGNFTAQWASKSHRPLLEELAAHFRLVQYDNRGWGMSTRGLPDNLRIEHYERDLDAVMDRCCPRPAILCGPVASGHVAALYAVRRPDRLAGLVLHAVNAEDALQAVRYLEDLARDSWENFLKIPAYNFYRLDPPADAIKYLREAVLPDDFFKHLRMPPHSILPVLPSITIPTLVMAPRGPSGPRVTGEAEGQRIAGLIPGARLIVNDPGNTTLPSDIEDFVSDLPSTGSERNLSLLKPGSSVLSPREIEVLRLLALGKSNVEIAKELVISRSTVQNHVSNIFTKISAANRTEAAVYAKERGIA
jgi:DNA-binding CsgD family transcriptional regulator/pimeloyl-ACP methyl ester carboxylesterase